MKKALLSITIIFLVSCTNNDNSINAPEANLSGIWLVSSTEEEVPLGGVWGNNDCLYAVGGSLAVDPSIHLGTVLREIDGTWVVEKEGFNSRLVLLGIAGISCNEIYVVGQVADGVDRGILLKYNGNEWEEIRTDISFTNIEIINSTVYITAWDGLYRIESDELVKIYDSEDHLVTDVWGINNELYLVGYNGEEDYIMQYDGDTWSSMFEEYKLQGNFLDRIEGISENEIYATGTGGNLLAYDGANWQILESGLLPIGGFKIFNSKDVYLATSRFRTGNRIYRYDLERQALETVFEADIPFYGLWGSNEVGIYAVGLEGTIVHNDVFK
ncbi:MAG: hypothetical protein AAGC45_05620 [Bacteroidota bacterium]